MVQRARMILLSMEGQPQREIGGALGCNFRTVGEGQRHWIADGFEGIEKERTRRGKKSWAVSTVSRELLGKTMEGTPDHPMESVPQCERVGAHKPGGGRSPQRSPQALHLDRQSHRHPGQSHPRRYFVQCSRFFARSKLAFQAQKVLSLVRAIPALGAARLQNPADALPQHIPTGKVQP